MIDIDDIKLVKQPTNDTCVAACLSMVTGVPVQEIIDEFKCLNIHPPYKEQDFLPFLVRKNILPILTSFLCWSAYMPRTINLCCGPSLNNTGGMHAYLILCRGDNWFNVLDPSNGDKVTHEDFITGKLLPERVIQLRDCSYIAKPWEF
jgi:hypothetical protein